jgi:ubiquinone/menaquinone biosynthesis C-methylase UbiE
MEEVRGLKSKELYPGIFSRHAVAYQRRLDEVMARGEARGRQRVIDVVEARSGMRILDLACGPGNMTRPLAARVAPSGEVVGVDLAPGMIELARSAGIQNARFEVMDIEALAFPDGTFDAAICGHGLQFVPDLPRALGEARRVLKDSGRLVASVPGAPVKDSVRALIDDVIERWLPAAPRVADDQTTRATVGDPDALRQAAIDAGFADARVEQVEEDVRWDSAEHLVSMLMSWWDCACRLEAVAADRREAFRKDALLAVKLEHPGAMTMTGRNLVLVAQK